MPDPSFIIPLFLQSALLPFCLTLALLFALRLNAVAVIALAAGFIASYFATLHAQWSLVPHQAIDWMPAITVLGALGALATENVKNAAARVIARLALSLAAAAVIAWPGLAGLGLQKTLLSVMLGAGLVCAAWTYLARAGQSRPTPPLLLMVVAGGAGMALMLDSSQAIGQLNGALASVLAACMVFQFLPRTRVVFSAAATGLAVLVLGALLLNAYLYAGFSLAYVALLAGGLLADPLVHAINRLRRRHDGAGSWTMATILAAIPVLITIGLAIKTAQEAGGY